MKGFKATAGGNDFIFIKSDNLDFSEDFIKKICDRRFGIGCDQIFFYKFNQGFQLFDVKIYNSDGIVAKNCGNGIRSLIKLLYINYGLTKFTFDTSFVLVHGEFDEKNQVPVVFFNKPIVKDNVVDIGNLHKVIIVEGFDSIDKNFDNDFNVNYVKILSKDSIEVMTVERGVGYTMSCGTGNSSSAFFCYEKKLVESSFIKIVNEKSVSYVGINDETLSLQGDCDVVFEFECLIF